MLDQATEKRIVDSLSCTYNTIGFDVWGNDVPDLEYFFDVLRDHLRTHVVGCDMCDATQEDVHKFYELTYLQQEHLMAKVGP